MSLDKRPRVLPIQKTSMPDLPMKPVQAKRTATRKRRSPSTSKGKTKPVKPSPKQQPRDPLGRFASKFLKGTVKVVKGTVKTVKKVHKTVKRIRSGARQRANVRMRERKIELARQEKKLGIKRKTVRRRKSR